MTSLALRIALLGCIAEGRGTTPPPASGLPTTMTLVNTSGSTQAANFVSPIFGMTFRKGDIPSGTAPTFTISGTPQPFSWGMLSYWNDGSLRHGSFMFRCSSSIAGSGTLSITINSGGTAPTTSARTLTEVYAQSLKVGGAGIGSFGGLSGTWNGYVRSDSNNTEQFVYLDGAAGKTWRIKTDMATTPGGSPHGQLLVYHFVTALTDNSGNLGGFRHIARINQPVYNSGSTPAQRSFASISTQYGAGPTSIPLTWPFNNINFTTAAASTTCTVAALGTQNLYGGAQSGGGDYVNVVPGYLSSTTDANLSTSQIYYAYTYGAANNNTVFRLGTNANGPSSHISMAGGIGTFVPIPVCLFGGSIFTADSQGRSNFFQGTGSMAADNTVRTQFNQTYLHSTGAIPPWSLSVNGTAFGGTIKDIPAIVGASSVSYWSGSPTWSPVNSGPLALASRGGPGSLPDIGPLTTFHCVHFYNQSAVSDLAVRSITFAGDFEGGGLRDAATGNYLNFGNSSYTNMPAPSSNQQSTVMAINSNCYGFTGPSTPPASGTGFLMGAEQDSQHRPNTTFYGFLVFGEPHFYDLLIESAQVAYLQTSGPARVPTSPAGYGIFFASSSQGLRGSTWGFRELMLAATFAAATPPDGSGITTYLSDLVGANFTFMDTLYSPTYLGSALSGQNSWRKVSVDNSFVDYSCGGFMMGYHECIMAWADGLGWSGARTWNNKYATWLNYVNSNFGLYHAYTEYDGATLVTNSSMGGPITSFTQYGITAGVYGSLSWRSSGTRRFTADGPVLGYVVTAGDQWVFHSDQGAPAGFSYSTGYYAVDVSGNDFNLSATVGGSPILPSNSGTLFPGFGSFTLDGSSPFLLLAAPPNAASGLIPSSSAGLNDSYLLYRKMAWGWKVAAGASGYSAVLTDATTRLSVFPPDFTTNANWLGQDTL